MNHITAVISSISLQVSIRKKPVKAFIPCAIECFKDTLKATVGIMATPFSAVTCGKFKTLNQLSELTSNGNEILPKLFKASMKVFNPSYTEEFGLGKNIFTDSIKEKINTKILRLGCHTWFQRHITLRAVHIAAIPVLTTTRLCDGAFAIPLIASVILCLGSKPDINAVATTHIKSFSRIFSDASIHLRGAFNPSSVSIIGKSINT